MEKIPKEVSRQSLWPGKDWLVSEAQLEANASVFYLILETHPKPLLEEIARAETPVISHHHHELVQLFHLNVLKNDCVIVCALPWRRREKDGKVCRVPPL